MKNDGSRRRLSNYKTKLLLIKQTKSDAQGLTTRKRKKVCLNLEKPREHRYNWRILAAECKRWREASFFVQHTHSSVFCVRCFVDWKCQVVIHCSSSVTWSQYYFRISGIPNSCNLNLDWHCYCYQAFLNHNSSKITIILREKLLGFFRRHSQPCSD